MLLLILVTISINQFCISEVSSRYLLINVEEERNTRHQTNGLSDNKKYIPKNSDLYETGYDLSEDPSTFANETFSDSWGHDLAETGGCSCNCKGECTPKGCNGARGKSTSRSFGAISNPRRICGCDAERCNWRECGSCCEGLPTNGGKPLNANGFCEHFCLFEPNGFRWCGDGPMYRTGRDCRKCRIIDPVPDKCKPNPCKNGGTCQDGDCSCPLHCAGKTCEKCKGCHPNPCKNGGTCIKGGPNGIKCECPKDATGPECERKIDLCEPNPCNGHPCSDGVCKCKTGCTGKHCENCDACIPNPCKNGGNCNDGICTCPPGFSGKHCGTKDPCDPNPCQNGGTCTDGSCSCPDECSGKKCETCDPCKPNPCKNGGTCTDGACDCKPGFKGPKCEIPDPCEPNPCKNGGTCTDGACECATGYSGTKCETSDTVTDKGIECCKEKGVHHHCFGYCLKKIKKSQSRSTTGICESWLEVIGKCKGDVPTQPGRPIIEGYDSNSCDLSWKIPASDGGSKITEYRIEYMEKVTGIWEQGTTVSVTDCDCKYQKGTCTGLTVGKEYVFRCIAVNNNGESLPSSESEAMVTRPPQPQDACCLEKGVPRMCLGICMGDCTETPDEIYRLVNSDNICNEHEPAAKECCDKEKGK